jgi:hypothetical protein
MDLGAVQQLLGQVGEVLLHAQLAAEAAQEGNAAEALHHALEAVGILR